MTDAVVQVDDVQHIEQLPFVFMDALDLYVEQGIHGEVHAAFFLHQPGQLLLVDAFRFGPLLVKIPVLFIGPWLELFDLGKIGDPCLTDLAADEGGHLGVGVGDPAPWRDAVGFVVEFFRPQLVEIPEQPLLEQIGMQFCHTVHRKTADDGQIGHAHGLAVVLIDDGHAPPAVAVARPVYGHFLEEAGIDLVNDFQQAGQQALEQMHRPAFQGLGQQRVVGIGHGIAGDFPGRLPLHFLFVHQQAHEFGHGNGRVGVVELKHVVLGEIAEIIAMIGFPLAHDVLETGGSQEILLAQAQLLAAFAGIVGVEHHGDVLGIVLGRYGFGVTAGVKFVQVELVGGSGFPQAQGVHHAVAIAGYGDIKGNGQHLLGVHPADTGLAAAVEEMLRAPAEMHRLGVFRPFQLPGVGVAQPVVGFFNLVAVFNVLAEHAVFVAQAIAEDGQLQGGAAVQETGSQAAQATVAQAGIGFFRLDFFQFQAEGLHGLGGFIRDVHVQQVVPQGAADEEFHGQVIGAALVRLAVLQPGVSPVRHDAVPHRQGKGFIEIQGVAAQEAPQVVNQITPEVMLQGFGVIGELFVVRNDAQFVAVAHDCRCG